MDAFYALAVLACPVGMGAMMWFMMKGYGRPGGAPAPQHKAAGHAEFGSTDPRQQELAALRKEVADLRAQVREGDGTEAEERAR